MRPAIFLDATVIKAALDTRLVLLPESKKIAWGRQEIEVTVHRPVYLNQNQYFLAQGKRDRFEDAVALRYIAALATEGKVELQLHHEVLIEVMGLPTARDHSPVFHGAPITQVPGPIWYGRTVADGSPPRWDATRERRLPSRDWQYEFLVALKHPRFQALQAACGAFQGHERPLHRNQLIDAFHLWCAESSGATYFLTHDDKLVDALTRPKRSRTSVIPITPKRLLAALLSKHPMWLWSLLKERWRLRRSGRDLYDPAQDASGEFNTGRRPRGF
jgi:hypothetical protein